MTLLGERLVEVVIVTGHRRVQDVAASWVPVTEMS